MLVLLGTGSALPSHRTTTMLALVQDERSFLIDCGGDAVQQMYKAGLDVAHLQGVLITHEHPDHVSGFPLLIEKLWLAGRRTSLPIYGIEPALEQAKRAFAAYNTSTWKDLFTFDWQPIPYEPEARAVSLPDWTIDTWPVQHPVPCVGMRIRWNASGKTVGYSCDTEPCAAVVELARGADVLVNEAAGAGRGHCSAEQAAQLAHEAGVERLVLVHVHATVPEADLAAARAIVPATWVGEDGDRVEV